MSEIIKPEVLSRRRALSLMGFAASFAAVPMTLLSVADADAQQADTGAMTGTERRQERRTARTERRHARRAGRAERRAARRTGRTERREERQGSQEKK
jgi:hypothetical protein